MRQSGAWAPNTNTLPYRGTSAGGGYSSVGDLVAFAEALMNHKLLNAEYTSMLFTGKVDVAEGRKYAYGFEDARVNGEGAVGHGGGAPGMNGELRIYPQSGYVIAVLSNLDPPAASRMTSFVDPRLPR
jgi:D-alanyl-D-alanine carboxypeptidase